MSVRGPAALRGAVLLALSCACGARSGLEDRDAGTRPPECVADTDCDDGLYCTGEERCLEGRCAPGAPVACADDDACTEDRCDEPRRACAHPALSRDADGDGFRGPREGARAGEPGACGDDCDDADRAVHPGATEVCNGRDDDCNGVIDDGATLRPSGDAVAVSEAPVAPSSPGGIVWTGARYAASFWGYEDSKAHVYFSALERSGARPTGVPRRRVTETPADAFGAGLAWTGAILGAVWQDRRDPSGGYEVYFNRLTPEGEKLGPDQRISFAPGFSVNPTITWTGTEFVLAWQDERDAVDSGTYEIYAQRVDDQGRLIGPNQRITRDPATSEAPVVASGPAGPAIAWMDGRGGGRAVFFAALNPDLARLVTDQRITATDQSAVAPALAWNRDRWVIAWHDDGDASPDHEVWGATRDAGGRALTLPRRLTTDPGYSRYPSLLPLGDRVLLAWADDREGGQYEVFARTFTPALDPLSPESRVTTAPGASVYPLPALGPEGDVGVLFRDQRDGRIRVYFTSLRCAIPRP